jgi:polysaccharide pyruvyl transferase WcaK-like protein
MSLFARVSSEAAPELDSAARPLIAVFGLFGSGNTGNDGSLEAMLASIKRLCREADVLCVCGEPDNIIRSFDTRAIPIYRPRSGNALIAKLAELLRPFQELKGCRLLIVPGTGALDDFGTSWSGLPLAFFAWCLAARLRGAKVAFVSIGAGPIRHPLSRRLFKAAIGMAGYRSYRDRFSKSFLQSIGFAADADPVYPDLAFALPTPAARKRSPGHNEPLTVGLGVMTYQGWRNDPAQGAAIYADYLAKIGRFALWLLDRGHSLRILMGDGTDQRAIDDLRRFLAEHRPAISPDCIHVAKCSTLHDLMHEIAETDVVVATRFHNVVCALKLGRPVLSIGYAEKNDALMTEVGLGRFCQSIETLDVDLLIQHFVELTGELDIWRTILDAVQPRYHAALMHQEALLASTVLQWRQRSTASHAPVSCGQTADE